MQKSRLLASLGAMMLMGMASIGRAFASYGGLPLSMGPGAEGSDYLPGRSSKGRPHHDTPGQRSHRKWRRARSSGRHDFRKAL